MTFLEAIEAIEHLAGKCGIKHRDGEPMEPIAALGKIGAYYGERFDSVLHSLEAGDISIEAYLLEMIKMIKGYQTREREIA